MAVGFGAGMTSPFAGSTLQGGRVVSHTTKGSKTSRKQIEALQKQYQQGLQQLLRVSSGYGQTARQRVADSATQQYARAQQQLLSRGLSGTTVAPAVYRGVAADVERQSQAIDEQVSERELGLRKEFQMPAMNTYLSLLQQLGQGSY